MSRAKRDGEATRPKPPRSVWVSGEAVRYMATNGWTRYDLHRPAKRKSKKARKR